MQVLILLLSVGKWLLRTLAVPAVYRSLLVILAVCAIYCIGYSSGAGHVQLKFDVYRAQSATALQTAKSQQAQAALQGVLAAKAKADLLTNQLAKQQQAIDQLTKEHTYAIQQTTTKQRCLNGATVRLLNSADHAALSTTNPTSSLAATSATLAANTAEQTPSLTDYVSYSDYSNDTDVAMWINNTQSMYATCRSRLGALIEFNTQPTPTHKDAQ